MEHIWEILKRRYKELEKIHIESKYKRKEV